MYSPIRAAGGGNKAGIAANRNGLRLSDGCLIGSESMTMDSARQQVGPKVGGLGLVDRYTKVVLTVIAACLVWNVASGLAHVRPALAQSGPVHVVVDAWGAYLASLPIPVTVSR